MYDFFGARGFFWTPHNTEIGDTGVSVSVAPGGGGPGGGFPGIFPGAGVSNSGWAGFQEFQERLRKCMKAGTCPVVWGPAAFWG